RTDLAHRAREPLVATAEDDTIISSSPRFFVVTIAAHYSFREAAMKKRLLMSAMCAAAVSLGAAAAMQAQEGNAPSIPQLAFKPVQNFFHYPAYSVIGRLSGVAVSPDGSKCLALHRGHH